MAKTPAKALPTPPDLPVPTPMRTRAGARASPFSTRLLRPPTPKAANISRSERAEGATAVSNLERFHAMNDRPLSPSPSQLVVSDHEAVNRAASGGRLPVMGGLKPNDPRGGNDWQGLHAGSPATIAAKAEREHTRARPDLVAKRDAKGK